MTWTLPWKRRSAVRITPDPIVPTRIIVTPRSMRAERAKPAAPLQPPSPSRLRLRLAVTPRTEPLLESSEPTLSARERRSKRIPRIPDHDPVRTTLGLVPLEMDDELMHEDDFCPATGKTVVLSVYAFDARKPLDESDDEIWLDIADPDTRDR